MKNTRQRDLAKIHIAKKQLGLDDDTYRAMLERVAGVGSAADLDAAGRRKVLTHLRKAGFRATSRRSAYRAPKKPMPRQKGNMVRLASGAQHEKIAALARLIEWRTENGLARWLFKRYSIQRVKTAQEAFKVIEGLKKMFENQMAKAHGPDWMDLVWEDPDVARYIEEHLSDR